MKELPPRYTLRVSQMLLDKLGYIVPTLKAAPKIKNWSR